MTDRLRPFLTVSAACLLLLVLSPAVAAAPPRHTLLIASSAADPKPGHSGTIAFRIRPLGPARHLHSGGALPNLHSIPANIQIRRPELPERPRPAAAGASGPKEDCASGTLVLNLFMFCLGLVFGLLTTALALRYVARSFLDGGAASTLYDALYGGEAPGSDSPKMALYYSAANVEAHGSGCKN